MKFDVIVQCIECGRDLPIDMHGCERMDGNKITILVTPVICKDCASEEQSNTFVALLKRVLDWRGLNGDGITEPLQHEIMAVLAHSLPLANNDTNLDQGAIDNIRAAGTSIHNDNFKCQLPEKPV